MHEPHARSCESPALVGLPLIAEQMRAGRLSYSKVRAITRIAEPANEASLVAVALAGTTAQVERVVAAYRRALPPDHEASDAAQWAKRGLHVRHNDDRTITLTVTLPTAAGMEVLAAVDHFAVPAGVDPDGERLSLAERRADAVVALAGAALAATDDQLATDRPRYLVHLHTGDERQEAHPEGSEEMGSGVSDATTRRLCCDADHETVVHDTVHDTVHGDGSGPGDGTGDGTGGGGEVVGVSARSSVIRGRLRRLVQLRDRTCQVPGCSHRAQGDPSPPPSRTWRNQPARQPATGVRLPPPSLARRRLAGRTARGWLGAVHPSQRAGDSAGAHSSRGRRRRCSCIRARCCRWPLQVAGRPPRSRLDPDHPVLTHPMARPVAHRMDARAAHRFS